MGRYKKAIYYQDAIGRTPAKDFISRFEVKTRAKILARVEFLSEHWQETRRPLVDMIDSDLYELRVEFAWNSVRIIYAYMFMNYIVLLHGFQKKQDKISNNDKLKARKRMIDFQTRYKEGKITLK